jgi:60 kDa SS-A/Ro ribonucleoprotein
MANKTLFASLRDALIPRTDTVNSENAPAYALASKQALAQYAATGCFGRTFYVTAEEQLTRVLELCDALIDHATRSSSRASQFTVEHSRS